MSQHGLVGGLAVLAVATGALGAWGGYRVGYDKAALEARVALAEKEAELARSQAAAPATGEGRGERADKPKFEPTEMVAEELGSLVPGLSGLTGTRLQTALYVLNNTVGGCPPCIDQAYSLGKCIQREPKLLDRKLCANLPTLSRRLVEEAGAGKGPDDVRAAVDFPQGWYPFEIPEDVPSKGRKDAPITMVEISDFQCPYCKKSQANVKAVLDKYGSDVRMVFVHQPLAMHKMARPAAVAAAAADRQGKFWEFHDALFASQGLDEGKIVGIAEALHLDMRRWEDDRKSVAVDQAVQRDQDLASRWKFTSTPTFLINGYRVKGAQPPEAFDRIIDLELKER
jgi:predicted DsbA family dithiol-disulfide isomerase